MKTAISMLAFAVLATASPALSPRTTPTGVKDASDACGDSVISCCNTSDTDSNSGLISTIVGPVLANNCLGVGLTAVNLLNVLTDTTGMCSNNEVKCCSGNKNTGVLVVDLQCTSL